MSELNLNEAKICTIQLEKNNYEAYFYAMAGYFGYIGLDNVAKFLRNPSLEDDLDIKLNNHQNIFINQLLLITASKYTYLFDHSDAFKSMQSLMKETNYIVDDYQFLNEFDDLSHYDGQYHVNSYIKKVRKIRSMASRTNVGINDNILKTRIIGGLSGKLSPLKTIFKVNKDISLDEVLKEIKMYWYEIFDTKSGQNLNLNFSDYNEHTDQRRSKYKNYNYQRGQNLNLNYSDYNEDTDQRRSNYQNYNYQNYNYQSYNYHDQGESNYQNNNYHKNRKSSLHFSQECTYKQPLVKHETHSNKQHDTRKNILDPTYKVTPKKATTEEVTSKKVQAKSIGNIKVTSKKATSAELTPKKVQMKSIGNIKLDIDDGCEDLSEDPVDTVYTVNRDDKITAKDDDAKTAIIITTTESDDAIKEDNDLEDSVDAIATINTTDTIFSADDKADERSTKVSQFDKTNISATETETFTEMKMPDNLQSYNYPNDVFREPKSAEVNNHADGIYEEPEKAAVNTDVVEIIHAVGIYEEPEKAAVNTDVVDIIKTETKGVKTIENEIKSNSEETKGIKTIENEIKVNLEEIITHGSNKNYSDYAKSIVTHAKPIPFNMNIPFNMKLIVSEDNNHYMKLYFPIKHMSELKIAVDACTKDKGLQYGSNTRLFYPYLQSSNNIYSNNIFDKLLRYLSYIGTTYKVTNMYYDDENEQNKLDKYPDIFFAVDPKLDTSTLFDFITYFAGFAIIWLSKLFSLKDLSPTKTEDATIIVSLEIDHIKNYLNSYLMKIWSNLLTIMIFYLL